MADAALDFDTMAAVIIAPSFDAVRDVFAAAHKRLGVDAGIDDVDLRINAARHDTERHFAACHSTGKRIEIAPEGADLPLETLTAIIAHEFGHAADFLSPGQWEFVARDKPARWVGMSENEEKQRARHQRWLERSDDEVEWAADAIAYAITGRRIGYCGPCLLQCFDGKLRPRGLR